MQPLVEAVYSPAQQRYLDRLEAYRERLQHPQNDEDDEIDSRRLDEAVMDAWDALTEEERIPFRARDPHGNLVG